ncbi:SPFH domain-containing protein [Fontisphaera persica]|uniref:SPFH domain-containing protein n=1 Tax=Fontisphaera persica TaxID=2974023 RepID=UPI0024BFCD37|nr:SPFH domain-containing protein [Fontisphaera persica]WCJ59339.1 SPFH domain-containing protein [Fontisphaera persica]
MNTPVQREVVTQTHNGWLMLPIVILMHLGSIALLIYSIVKGARLYEHPLWTPFTLAILGIIGSVICFMGFFTLQPNEARVLILFGEYKGTVRRSGFHWGNPFYSNGPAKVGADGEPKSGGSARKGHPGFTRYKISLRARNLNGEKLKVNDKRGNPIEIAAVVVWRVADTAQALFDVDDYESYVRIQSESAVRHLASCYAYDHGEENEITLRSGVEEVSAALQKELQERLNKAGVIVEEARLTHLAYAPEIAQAMLRRQQAEAVIAARQKIVQGAVSMVDMALKELASKHVLEMDDERKAAMVSNLMVVLCGESEVHPVVNTGTLYT